VPRPKKATKKAIRKTAAETHSSETNNSSFLQRIQSETRNQFSYLNLILGGLILLVAGILIFNYFSRPNGDLGTSQTTTASPTTSVDVTKDSLPGTYTVKADDTLFSIAEKYYGDGYQFTKLAEANKLTDPGLIIEGQVLNIPKLDLAQRDQTPQATIAPTSEPSPTESTNTPSLNAGDEKTQPVDGGKGGAVNQTEWGEKITADTYTVVSGDWLSKIAGRAYGDIYAFQKIADANGITDPNVIEPDTVLKIPR